MQYCSICAMPSTRPGITFNEDEVCSGCQTYQGKSKIDWASRWTELEELCAKYRKQKSPLGYDCVIAVSGGKDSHYQTYVFKELLKMNPLLVSVEDNFPMTQAGIHNLNNIRETFGCEIIALKPNIAAQKKIMRYTFENYGKPTWYIDRLIYTYPLHIATQLGIPLLIYGENVSFEYGGNGGIETYSAKDQLSNGVASDIPYDELMSISGIKESDLFLTLAPEMNNKIDPIYLSYFVPWNSYSNYVLAKKKGFHDLTHEWERTHHVEQFDQVDSAAYLVHSWMKYPKFGHASATDYASRFIRYGILPREEGIDLVKKHDHALDPKSVQEFVEFLGYSHTEFYEILDSFYNTDLFVKDAFGQWVLKDPVWNHR